MPSVLTTFGVLGTFIGITYGLLDFNTTNISSDMLLIHLLTTIEQTIPTIDVKKAIFNPLNRTEILADIFVVLKSKSP